VPETLLSYEVLFLGAFLLHTYFDLGHSSIKDAIILMFVTVLADLDSYPFISSRPCSYPDVAAK
jgi:hypothetical protein